MGKDYRGFLFVQHNDHGLLLLHCTRKKDKPNHWQLPGGHIDEADFVEARKEKTDENEILWLAAKIGAARELFEETGIDLRSSLHRLVPALQSNTEGGAYKTRRFFSVKVDDTDTAQDAGTATARTSMGTGQEHLKLRLSHEHSGFKFQPDIDAAVEETTLHSGGVVAKALADAKQSSEVV